MLFFRVRLLIKTIINNSVFKICILEKKSDFWGTLYMGRVTRYFKLAGKGLKNSTNLVHEKILAEKLGKSGRSHWGRQFAFVRNSFLFLHVANGVTCFGVMRDSAVTIRNAYCVRRNIIVKLYKNTVCVCSFDKYYINII